MDAGPASVVPALLHLKVRVCRSWSKSDTLIRRSLNPLSAWASGKTQRGQK